MNNKCVDPCPGVCGQNAECQVINHLLTCSCNPNFEGDPFTACQPVKSKSLYMKCWNFVLRKGKDNVLYYAERINPCNPSPCGPYSSCQEIGDQASCSCMKTYFGSPPSCRPECIASTDCPQNKACINEKCENPCTNACGQNTLCNVRNHNPLCSCPPGFTGDPFANCFPTRK